MHIATRTSVKKFVDLNSTWFFFRFFLTFKFTTINFGNLGNKRAVTLIKKPQIKETHSLKILWNSCGVLDLFLPLHELKQLLKGKTFQLGTWQLHATTLVTLRKGYACIKLWFSVPEFMSYYIMYILGACQYRDHHNSCAKGIRLKFLLNFFENLQNAKFLRGNFFL